MPHLITLMILIILAAGSSQAATRYVDVDCGNVSTYNSATGACTGGSETNRNTIVGGIAVTGAGDTLLIRGGTYTERISSNSITIPRGTSEGTRVTIGGYPGETVILEPVGGSAQIIELVTPDSTGLPHQYITFQDMILDGSSMTSTGANGLGSCIQLGYSQGKNINRVRLARLEIRDCPGYGVYNIGSFFEFINLHVHHNGSAADYTISNGLYSEANNSIVDGGEFNNNEAAGVRFWDGTNDVGDNNVVRRAYIHDNGQYQATNGYGIILGGRNNVVHHNIISNTGQAISGSGYGMTVGWGTTTGNRIYQNTVFNSKNTDIELRAASSSTTVRNNIARTAGITNAGSGNTLSNNACSVGGAACSVTSDPQFVNSGAGSFDLQSSSPAINAGLAISPCPSGMICAFNGAAPDIGAFETWDCPAGPSATVEDTAPDKIVLNCTPIQQPIFGSSGFSARKNPPTGWTIDTQAPQGNTQILLDTNASAINTDTLDFSYVTTGNFRDGADIGRALGAAGTGKGQRLNAITNRSITNNVGVGAGTLTLTHTGLTLVDQATPDVWLAKDAHLTIPSGGCVQWWVQVENASVVAPVQGYKPRASQDGGAFADLTADTSQNIYVGIDRAKNFGDTAAVCQLATDAVTCLTPTYLVDSAGSYPQVDFASVPKRKEWAVDVCLKTGQPDGRYFELCMADQSSTNLSGCAGSLLTRLTVGADSAFSLDQ